MKLRSLVLMAGLAVVGSVSAQDADDTPLELPLIESVELQAPVDPFAEPPGEPVVAPEPVVATPKPVVATPKPVQVAPAPVEPIKFDDSSAQPSRPQSALSARPGKMTAAELRQARALYRSAQRIRRLEMNAWMGHEPLRPNWTSIPSMTSRYPARHTIYVPVYIYSH